MIGVLKKLFDSPGNGSSAPGNAGREERLKVATCVILLEAANADESFSGEERAKVVDILRKKFSMSGAEVEDLISESVMERKDATDLWHFTTIINRSMDNEEKYGLMELVWEVIYSDGTLDRFENYIAHKLLGMLNIDHSKFIELKMKVRAGAEGG